MPNPKSRAHSAMLMLCISFGLPFWMTGCTDPNAAAGGTTNGLSVGQQPWIGTWYVANQSYDSGCINEFTDDSFSEYCPNWSGVVTKSVTYDARGSNVEIKTPDSASIFRFRMPDGNTMATDSATEVAHLAGPYSLKRCPDPDIMKCSQAVVAAAQQEQKRVDDAAAEKERAAQAAADKDQADAAANAAAAEAQQRDAERAADQARLDLIRQACSSGQSLRVRTTEYIGNNSYVFNGQVVLPISGANDHPDRTCDVQIQRGNSVVTANIPLGSLVVPDSGSN